MFYRGVYESEDFRAVRLFSIFLRHCLTPSTQVTKYEQDLVITRDDEVTKFLDKFFKQVEGTLVHQHSLITREPIFLVWLGQNLIHRVILVIVSKDTGKTLERWAFNLEPHTGYHIHLVSESPSLTLAFFTQSCKPRQNTT